MRLEISHDRNRIEDSNIKAVSLLLFVFHREEESIVYKDCQGSIQDWIAWLDCMPILEDLQDVKGCLVLSLVCCFAWM